MSCARTWHISERLNRAAPGRQRSAPAPPEWMTIGLFCLAISSQGGNVCFIWNKWKVQLLSGDGAAATGSHQIQLVPSRKQLPILFHFPLRWNMGLCCFQLGPWCVCVSSWNTAAFSYLGRPKNLLRLFIPVALTACRYTNRSPVPLLPMDKHEQCVRCGQFRRLLAASSDAGRAKRSLHSSATFSLGRRNSIDPRDPQGVDHWVPILLHPMNCVTRRRNKFRLAFNEQHVTWSLGKLFKNNAKQIKNVLIVSSWNLITSCRHFPLIQPRAVYRLNVTFKQFLHISNLHKLMEGLYLHKKSHNNF